MIAYARPRESRWFPAPTATCLPGKSSPTGWSASGLDSIIFAIDGVTQSSYERFRQEEIWRRCSKGSGPCRTAKKALRSRTPLINFRFIVTAQNEAEIPLVKQLAPSVGADALTFKTLNPDCSDVYSPLSSESGGKALMPEESRYRRFGLVPGGAAGLPAAQPL